MLCFNLEKPVRLVWVGEFISPERGWKHLTRTLIDYELMVVTEGQLEIGDENADYTVRAGEYLIMSPTRFQHGTKECKCRFYWLHFSAPALPATLTIPAQGKFTDGERISQIMKSLFRAEGEGHCGPHSHYLASELLFELAAQTSSVQGEVPAPDSAHALCERVKALVAAKRLSDLRVKEIASELGYHEKYLSAVFREREGITLKGYLSAQRLAEAKRILSETNFTVAEVAYCLNFENPHNFSRFFKREEGITPSEYRAQNKL